MVMWWCYDVVMAGYQKETAGSRILVKCAHVVAVRERAFTKKSIRWH